jgi:hypothetical protein
MMTEKIQKKHANLFTHLGDLAISIDAGNRASYEQVRLGGDWDLLWTNIDYFYSTNWDRDNTWCWDLIVQKNNYQSIPELIDIARTRFDKKLPKISLTPVLNWGTWSEAEYLDHAVHLPTHADHAQYQTVMALPTVRDYLAQQAPKWQVRPLDQMSRNK